MEFDMSFSNIAFADEVAQTAASLPQESAMMNFVPIILIFLIFYFLLIRPQVRKQKEQQALINSVKRGDKVIIAGGIIGVFVKEEEGNIVEIEIAKDIKVKALKHTITSIINNKAEAAPVEDKKITGKTEPKKKVKSTK